GAAQEDVPDEVGAAGFNAGLAAGGQAAHFEHQLGVAVIEGGDLRVGSLLVVIVNVLASGGDNGFGKSTAQAPAGDIHFVDALVADIAVAGVPEPVPVVFEP